MASVRVAKTFYVMPSFVERNTMLIRMAQGSSAIQADGAEQCVQIGFCLTIGAVSGSLITALTMQKYRHSDEDEGDRLRYPPCVVDDQDPWTRPRETSLESISVW